MRKLLILFIVISTVIIFKNTTYAELQGMNTDELVSIGKEVYDRKGCAGCHKIAGAGGDLGPDLTNEGNIEKLRDELNKAVREGFTRDYENLIRRYYEALQKEKIVN